MRGLVRVLVQLYLYKSVNLNSRGLPVPVFFHCDAHTFIVTSYACISTRAVAGSCSDYGWKSISTNSRHVLKSILPSLAVLAIINV